MTKTDLTRITDISKAIESPEAEAAALPEDMLGQDSNTTFFAPDELTPPLGTSSTSAAASEVRDSEIPVEPAAPSEIQTVTKIFSPEGPSGAPLDTSPSASVQGAAAYPFTLRIDGFLRPHDRSRLEDILSNEKIGVRAVDLEPQIDAGHVMIPRISEFAGIAIVQSLRDAPVRMWLTPSERAEDDARPKPTVPDHLSRMVRTPRSHLSAADTLPLLTGDHSDYVPFDAITTSANLQSAYVEATDSPEYSRLMEALSRQLKYQARTKGADAVVRFSITLVPLSSAQSYKLIASGLAARRK